ncbi:MAG: sugar phosphorylase [Anaerolineales bacterium]
MDQTFYTTELTTLYGPALASQVEARLKNLLQLYRGRIPTPLASTLSERDSILITYADQVRKAGQPHLKTLAEFCQNHLNGIVAGLHILPFFPWSSDDGFSVMDYRKVDTALGDWRDFEHLGQEFRLMVDGVINHISAQSEWFQAFLQDEPPYRDYFLTVEGNPDLSDVVRPRALPLLTEFITKSGPRRVWTTFSADQVDLDYHNPDVLLEILDILLMYAERGTRFIRLDAIAYLWKEIGTTCIHLPQTHAFIRLLRAVLNDVAPHVQLITETNVPHEDNIAYFGNGTDEAQLVYNFALPPLLMHTLRTGDASILSAWAAELQFPSGQTTFFNFLASHDGIGLNPARGILSPDDIDNLVTQTLAHGGLISFKQNSDGSQTPYEMNINYFDTLSNPMGDEPISLQVDRFMAAQAIMLSLIGVPGIYFHSLFGSRNWNRGVELTKHNRTINRQKLDLDPLEHELSDPRTLRSQVFRRYRQLLLRRAASSAFDPHGKQEIVDLGQKIFALLRSSPGGDQRMLCLQNVTPHIQSISKYTLEPYQTLWLDNP